MEAADAAILNEPPTAFAPHAARGWDWRPLALWIASGVVLLAGLGGRPVQRTQEARVLETARQMLGKPLDRWMVPRVNERLRLRKPPIAYWGAAAAFSVGGVSEAVGRIPTALTGWLTIGCTYWAGAWLFGRRAGLLSAAALLSGYLFFWYTRLAETDAWATLFVTFGTLAFWKAVEADPLAPIDAPPPKRRAMWFHLGAACVAAAFLSKFGPAVFPILFLVALTLVRRRPGVLWAFVKCGAPLTAVVPGILWLWYAGRHAGLGQVAEEFNNNWRGQGHGKPFYSYFYLLPMAAAPWTGVLVIAGIEAVRRWGRDPRLQGLILWNLSILLPLLVTGNKQVHYLLTMMPCAMLLVGWALTEMLELSEPGAEASRSVLTRPPFAHAVAGTFAVTVALCLLAAAGPPLAARAERGDVRTLDVALAAAMAMAMGAVLWLWHTRRGGHAVWAFASAFAVVLAVCNGWWWPSVQNNDPRAVGREFRRVAGNGPYTSYGTVAYLPLCFSLRAEVMSAVTPEDLRRQAAAEPNLHVVIRRRRRDVRPLPDPGFVRALEIPNEDEVFELYRPAPR